MKPTKKKSKRRSVGDTRRAVGYVRVSTDEQSLSIEAQAAKIEAYAALYDLELVGVLIDESASGKTLERRPQLARALSMLEADEADALLVTRLDRLTRSVRDLGALLERYFGADRWSLLSVAENIDTSTAGGRLVLNVLGSVAQWEREAIGERVSAAIRHKQSKGEYIGGASPFGFRVIEGKLEAHGDERAIIEEAKRLHEAGRLSLRKIAAKLESRGLVSRDGRRFHAMQIKRMLEAAA